MTIGCAHGILRMFAVTACVVSLALPVFAPPAGAAERPRVDDSFRLAQRSMSMDDAIRMAEQRFNAKVVRASVSEANGRRVYVLRLVSNDQRVFSVRVDAESGAFL